LEQSHLALVLLEFELQVPFVRVFDVLFELSARFGLVYAFLGSQVQLGFLDLNAYQFLVFLLLQNLQLLPSDSLAAGVDNPLLHGFSESHLVQRPQLNRKIFAHFNFELICLGLPAAEVSRQTLSELSVHNIASSPFILESSDLLSSLNSVLSLNRPDFLSGFQSFE